MTSVPTTQEELARHVAEHSNNLRGRFGIRAIPMHTRWVEDVLHYNHLPLKVVVVGRVVHAHLTTASGDPFPRALIAIRPMAIEDGQIASQSLGQLGRFDNAPPLPYDMIWGTRINRVGSRTVLLVHDSRTVDPLVGDHHLLRIPPDSLDAGNIVMLESLVVRHSLDSDGQRHRRITWNSWRSRFELLTVKLLADSPADLLDGI